MVAKSCCIFLSAKVAWASVYLALALLAIPTSGQTGSAVGPAATPVPTPQPTPYMPDGHPNLNGVWTTGLPAGGVAGLITQVSPDGKKREVDFRSVSNSPEENRRLGRAAAAKRPKDPNQPVYKADLVAKVKQLAANPDHNDPSFVCKPAGVPRTGAPNQIVQAEGMIVFLYSTNFYRIVPTDGRPHQKDPDPSYMGDSVGYWEGNTLVVDVVGFNDDTWLAPGGYFHSESLHVTERLTREGSLLHYQATIEDPEVLTQPWVMNPKTLKLGGSNDALVEAAPCKDLDEPHMPSGVN